MPAMDWKIEVVPLPITDIDRSVAFYRDQVGFNLDVDTSPWEGIRFVQLTPPGSACSIVFGDGIIDTPPGSIQGLQIVVDEIDAAREELLSRGVDVSPIQHYTENGLADGKGGDWNSFVFFSDPDGNSWTVQQRPPGR
jgi:catechol 2,3-dioxygenase-like lactoylglutathione lyase family enzyme